MWVDLGTMREGRSWPPASYLWNMQANVLARDVACCQGAASPAPPVLIICKLVWPSTPRKAPARMLQSALTMILCTI